MPNDRDVAIALQKRFHGDPQGLAQHLADICLNQTGVAREVFVILDRFSTYDVGCRFLNLLPTATLLGLTKTQTGKALCEMLLRWFLNPQPLDNQAPICPGVDFVIQMKRLKDAIDGAPAQPEASGSGIPYANLKEGENIRLSPLVVEKLTKVAADYFTATGKYLTITDGDRTALEQAYMMIRQIRKGEIGLYTQKQAAAEVKKAYDAAQASRKSDAQTAQDISVVIQNQMDSQNVYISRHLRGGGADIRSRDMTTKDRNAFNQAAKNHGVTVLKEGDHLHLQF